MKKVYAWLCIGAILLCFCACSNVVEPAQSYSPDTPGGVEIRGGYVEKDPAQPETQPQQTEPEETEPDRLPFLSAPEDSDLVPVQSYVPGIRVELKYATEDNFTGRVIYDFSDVYLRYGTVKKLLAVQQELQTMGLGLKIWDGFRPVQAQFDLWSVCPDPTYVANPNNGYSSHSRGNTVDIVLVDSQGQELTMPTGFDDFSALADRDYTDCSQAAAENALLLEQLMEKYGFSGYYREWWHYSDTVSYPVEQCFDPAVISIWEPNCREFITLRAQPDVQSAALTTIRVGETFLLLGYSDAFSFVQYQDARGYVLTDYTVPGA